MEPIKTKVIQIGNSKGIRIPKFIIDILGLEGDIELEIDEEAKELHIRPQKKVRENWDMYFEEMHENHDDKLLIDDGIDNDLDDW